MRWPLALWLLGILACSTPHPASRPRVLPPAASAMRLRPDLAALRAYFEASVERPRLLLLLSPS